MLRIVDKSASEKTSDGTNTEEKNASATSDKERVTQILNLGKIVSMSWNMGITISSSRMPKVNKPFVRLTLQVAHGSGQIKTYHVTLSLSQFQHFREELSQTKKMMEEMN
ncbi:hypothetical protein RFI_24293 [Reticulomyxa filosa]|uniref:COMM domain-containing protein n=1 Tax=Reticulomyxa filosa TaxID=46433 RepID=X6MHD1_RETFI|nr:hypothetical protein RFI_24293 [Reticulomyxa filosa]|eukprot:ETO13081.1 hypothetical protein RFI_24293 [Reticulomyxa filosa]